MLRRDALRRLGAAGAGALLGSSLPAIASDESAANPIRVAGREAELVITPVSAATLRVSLLPIEYGRAVPVEASLVFAENQWPTPALRIRNMTGPQTVPWQERRVQLSVDGTNLKLAIESTRPTRALTVDLDEGAVRFVCEGRIFGLGEGGPQFDRSGQSYAMKNGEGVHDLAVNGAVVDQHYRLGPVLSRTARQLRSGRGRHLRTARLRIASPAGLLLGVRGQSA